MYVTVRRYEGVRNAAEAARKVREGFVPLISDMDGFLGYYWIDAGDGVMLSTSIFESKAEADASNLMAVAWVRANKLSEDLPNPPQITEGMVVAEASAASPGKQPTPSAPEAPAAP